MTPFSGGPVPRRALALPAALLTTGFGSYLSKRKCCDLRTARGAASPGSRWWTGRSRV